MLSSIALYPVSGLSQLIYSYMPQLVTLSDTSLHAPSLVSLGGVLYLGWVGVGNNFLNVMTSTDRGASFGNKHIIASETSGNALCLCVLGDSILISWTGVGNDSINVAQLVLSAGVVTGYQNKVVLGQTSDTAPSLVALGSALYLGWKGHGNSNLNVSVSTNAGASFSKPLVSAQTSWDAPTLAVRGSELFVAWTGVGNRMLNVAPCVLGSGGVVSGFKPVVLGDTSTSSPALVSLAGVQLFLAWRGVGNDELNVEISSDNGVTFGSKAVTAQTSPEGPALCVLDRGLFIAWKGDGNNNLNVASLELDTI